MRKQEKGGKSRERDNRGGGTEQLRGEEGRREVAIIGGEISGRESRKGEE